MCRCQVMGTASTMALMAEAIGMMLPGGASIPAVHADRMRHAELSGARAVELARRSVEDEAAAAAGEAVEGPREAVAPTEIMTQESLENSLRILLAVGGSTNGLVSINDEFCIKIEQLCIYNDDFFFKNDGFCIKNDEFWSCISLPSQAGSG